MVGRYVLLIFFCLFCCYKSVPCYAQTQDEEFKKSVEQLSKDVIKSKKRKARHWILYSSLDVTYGYESNVNLTHQPKADTYEEEAFSLSYIQKLAQKLFLTADYTVDSQNYNVITDANNILNHMRVALNRSVGKSFIVGAGYDTSWEYFQNYKEGQYFFPKAFVYVRQKMASRFFHQLTFERGWKQYMHQQALGDLLSLPQDKKQLDNRQSIEYSVGGAITQRLFVKLRGRYSINDSNAKYQNFYDYVSWDIYPRFYYQLTKRLRFVGGGSYTRRIYKNRLTTDQSSKQKDSSYGLNAGFFYRLTRHNQVSISYAYLQGISNDDPSQYIDRTMNVRWLYDF